MNELLKLNDELWGAPAGVLIAFFAIALGYVLKTVPAVNNRYIPIFIVLTCTAGFMLAAPGRLDTMPPRIYHTRNFMIGFIIGFAAWTFHAQLLKRFVDPYFFNQDGSTKFFRKPTDTDNPPKP